LFFGLAMATKVSSGPFAIAFAAAAAIYLFQRSTRDPEFRSRALHVVKALAIAGLVAAAVFLIAEPYALIDHHRFFGDVNEQSEMVRRIRDYPYTRQYVDTTPYLYQMRQLTVWGMGLPAGVLMWAGLAFCVVIAIARRNRSHILLLSWALPYFIITGGFQVKFLRYLLPLTPFLAIMAGSLVTSAVSWLRAHRNAVLRPQLAYAATAIVILASLLYAIAYVRIYAKPHTATTAAEWVHEHIPTGATIAQTHWEEGLRNLAGYHLTELPLYDDDNSTKRDVLINRLVDAKLVIFYSNRLYGVAPRLPDRYPMSVAVIDKLFEDDLGYTLVHWESSYPNVLGVSLADDTFSRAGVPKPKEIDGYKQTRVSLNLGFADESFTVYDHPLVLIFQKTFDGTDAQYRAFLDQAIPQPPIPHAPATQGFGLLLSPGDAAYQQSHGTWSHLFSPGDWVNKVPWLVWYLTVQLAFLLALPITLTVFRRLPDHGYLLGKMLGILLITYIPWLLASLHWLDFSALSILFAMALTYAGSTFLFRRRRDEMLAFFREHTRLIIGCELLFLVAFGAMYGIRIANPDLWHPYRGGEKPMDFAYFNAIVRSSTFPPYDPWFSGGYLNYYYFGHLMNAALAKFTGIVPVKAIVLATPLFFALTVAGVFSVVYNLAAIVKRHLERGVPRPRMPSPVWAALAAVLFVAVIGNLDGFVQLVQGHGFHSFDYWRSSRLMPPDPPGFEITEFPYFTYLFADPHAHLFVIPLTLLALGLGLACIMSTVEAQPPAPPSAARRTRGIFPLVFLGLTLGAILATNSWDVITYAIVGATAVIIAEYGYWRAFHWRFVVSAIGDVAVLGLLAGLFFLPYIVHYEAPVPEHPQSWVDKIPLIGNALDATFNREATHTRLWQYLEIHSLFAVLICTFIGWLAWRRFGGALEVRWPRLSVRGGFRLPRAFPSRAVWRMPKDIWQRTGWRRAIVVVVIAAIAAASAATGYETVGLLGIVLLLVLALAVREVVAREEAMPILLFVLLLIAVAFAIGIFVDLFVFSNDIDRQNTVFKFYLQAWVLMGLVSAFALWRMRFGADITPFAARWAWRGAVISLAFAVLIYPALATPARLRDRFGTSIGVTTDASKFMEAADYQNPHVKDPLILAWDLDAIHWMEENIQGSPVIVEGISDLYTWANRVSIYTGLPDVIGWDFHQKQQRQQYQWAIERRRNDVNFFYQTGDPRSAADFLREYNVRYVYVGQLERGLYPPFGIAKFDTMAQQGLLKKVYANEQVEVYQVVPQPSS
ncbi:MAG: hypothetical protein HY261_04370, partial [Chloroflexi bacterium]|nr:hypothetical protein [Chloroflexota bacterium]